MRVAVMQPYFLPYAGYFRLFVGTDAFVILDGVQFPRRGWVHRNRLRRASGEIDWLTLPLAYAPQSARIAEMRLHPLTRQLWLERCKRFPAAMNAADRPSVAMVLARLACPGPDLVTYLQDLLTQCLHALGLRPPPLLRHTELAASGDFDPTLPTVLALCRQLRVREYVNLAGGATLYDPVEFRHHGVRLGFLPHWEGDHLSVLESLRQGDPRRAGADVVAQSTPRFCD